MRGYTLSLLAIDDLADIKQFIATDSIASAERVIADIFDRFDLISRHPEIGALRPEFVSHTSLRVHSVGKYAIVYHVDEQIVIYRIIHGARNFDDLF